MDRHLKTLTPLLAPMLCRSLHKPNLTRVRHRQSQHNQSRGFSTKWPMLADSNIWPIARSGPTLRGSDGLSCSTTNGTRRRWGE